MIKKNLSRYLFALTCVALVSANAGRSSLAAEASRPGKDGDTIPTWDMASPSMVSNLQSFIGTEPAASLNAQIPSFSVLQSLSPDNKAHRYLMGALAKHLPAGFNARLAQALKSPKEHQAKLKTLAGQAAAAHAQAAPEAAFAAQILAENIAASFAGRQTNAANLTKAADLLQDYSFYGPLVSRNPKIQAFRKIARTAWTMQAVETARQMAMNLINDTHRFNDAGVLERISAPRYSRQEFLAGAERFPKDEPESDAAAEALIAPPPPASKQPIQDIGARNSPANSGQRALKVLRKERHYAAPEASSYDGPRYRIDSKVFDFYAPIGGDMQSVADHIAAMVKNGQDRILLDLDDSTVRTARLKLHLAVRIEGGKITGLKEILATYWDKDGDKIIRVWPLGS